MKQTVFITGATSGFGEACANKFVSEGYRLIINGRRKERLEALAESLKQQFGVDILIAPFDVRDREAVFAFVHSLPEDWKHIDVLINNAGLALGRDNFEAANLDDWDTMVDTNLKGVAYVSKAIIPLMIAAKSGHIINISSTAGKEIYPQGNMYCATKHAVSALSEAMRIDLLPYNIKVTTICPGAADTEFSTVRFKGDKGLADKVYEGITPLYAEDVADVIYYCASLPSHVCINDLVLTCTQQANSFFMHRNG
ncbi:MAG: SDR family NAD(P)-dependent oxidoreductase [Niabella sp.]